MTAEERNRYLHVEIFGEVPNSDSDSEARANSIRKSRGYFVLCVFFFFFNLLGTGKNGPTKNIREKNSIKSSKPGKKQPKENKNQNNPKPIKLNHKQQQTKKQKKPPKSKTKMNQLFKEKNLTYCILLHFFLRVLEGKF